MISVMVNFRFMTGHFGRGLFLIYVGSLCWTDSNNLVQIIMAIVMAACGVINIMLYFSGAGTKKEFGVEEEALLEK